MFHLRYIAILFIITFFIGCTTMKEINPPPTTGEGPSDTSLNDSLSSLQAPRAKKIPTELKIHNRTIIDNYHWLKDVTRKDPDVIAYIEAENDYTNKMMADTEQLQEKLFDEMISRIKETDMTVTTRIDDYFYYSRTEKGKQYNILCRKKGNLDAPEEVFLDINQLAEGKKYFDLDDVSRSPDHRYIAYAVDENGSEFYRMYVKDTRTGAILEDTAYPIASIEWAADNDTIFYTTVDETKRSNKVFRHKLGEPGDNDVLIYQEDDEAFYAWMDTTRDKKYLVMGVSSKTSSEMRVLQSDTPEGKFTLFHPREPELKYYIDHRDGYFYIETNADEAFNDKIMKTPVTQTGRSNWTPFLDHRTDVLLTGFSIFKDFIVIGERENGVDTFKVQNLNTNESYYIEFPEPIYSTHSHGNPMFDTDVFRFSYTSLVTPYSVIDYHLDTKTWEVKKEQEVLGGFKKEDFQSERVFATADDGTRVPISLVYKKDLFKKDGSGPLYMESYGAYGESSTVYFSTARLSLLERGFVYAIAHIRGGREMGEKWYEDGKMLNKKNTFTDFIACSQFLINEKYTSPEKFVIWGASAGGLLMGAVANMAPQLYKVIILDVPFVDVINTMLDPSLSATVTEYEEWGNPNEEKYFDYIFSYCPYQNVKKQAYPNMFLSAGFYDPRVNFWEPAKLTAKFRDMKTDDNIVLLKTNMAGHGGATGRYDFMKEIAFEYAYIFKMLGMMDVK